MVGAFLLPASWQRLSLSSKLCLTPVHSTAALGCLASDIPSSPTFISGISPTSSFHMVTHLSPFSFSDWCLYTCPVLGPYYQIPWALKTFKNAPTPQLWKGITVQHPAACSRRPFLCDGFVTFMQLKPERLASLGLRVVHLEVIFYGGRDHEARSEWQAQPS